MNVAYNPADDMDPLFPDSVIPPQPSREPGPKPEKAVTSAWCPSCLSNVKTGLVRQGEHLVWRIHDRITQSGARIGCPASGIPVCTTDHRGTAGELTATCRHLMEGPSA